MRLHKVKSKNSVSYRVIKSAYINQKRTSVTVETLGSEQYIKDTYGVDDAEKWAREYVDRLNSQAGQARTQATISLDPTRSIGAARRQFNGGYLFLQDIYYDLGLDRICKAVKKKHSFEYNLNSILSRLIYSRIIYPSSKLSSFEHAHKFVEAPDFDLQHVYRALSVIADDSDYIQSTLYKNSVRMSARKTGVIYYDCTNYFFEIDEDDELRRHGVSKEHRPNPIVQMGMFMDGDGIPLAFCINPGNTSEQVTLQPLEAKLLEDFSMSRFVVCTDAGLSSAANRKFNNTPSRAFITTQSIKTLKTHLMEWALSAEGWSLPGDKKVYCLNEIDEEEMHDSTFYKERWINENGLEQRLIVSYSVKSRNYARAIRGKQVSRAISLSEKPAELNHKKENDPRRFIKETKLTKDGEVADRKVLEIDYGRISSEEKFDGFYGICTNLEDDPSDIIRVNSRRWQIEECFRIMKSEFKARPVYLSRSDRIKAHFMVCFIALIVFRYLEKKLDEKYTCEEIIDTLRDYNFLKLEGHGYVPTYSNGKIINALHHAFGFDTAKEMVTITDMKGICAGTKK